MGQFQTIKAVMNGGIMTPIMDGRTDSEKYGTGFRVLENFLPRSYGGIFKRPGTRFGASGSDVTGCIRTIGIKRAVGTNFILALHVNKINVWSYSGTSFSLVQTLTTTYTEAEIRALHWVTLNDITWLTVGTQHPKQVIRASDGTWSFVDVPFQFAPTLDPPKDEVTMRLLYDANDWNTSSVYVKDSIATIPFTKAITGATLLTGNILITSASHGLSNNDVVTIFGVGGATNANGTWTITVNNANEFILTNPTGALPATYTTGTGAFYLTNDTSYVKTYIYNSATASTAGIFRSANWTELAYRSPWNVGQTYVAGDVTEYFGSNYFWRGTSTVATSANRPGVGSDWILITVTDYRLIASAAAFTSSEVGSTWLLSPGSSNRISSELIPTAIGTTTSAAVFIQGSYLARTTWSSSSSPNDTTLSLQESLDRINFTTIREWYISKSVEGSISYPADAPNTGAWYRWICVKRSATGGAEAAMTIEPSNGKLDVPFKIESFVSSTQVRGIPKLAVDSLIPNEVIGFTFPVWRKGAFSVSRGYPKTCAFHDNRFFFANTATEPTRIWGSQIDDFYTFLTGSFDTSALDTSPAATQSNDIQWLCSFKRTLVIGTASEEWTMDSGDTDSALTPSNARLRRWSHYGSGPLQPVISGDGLLWLTRDNRLREFAYVFERDGYSAPEMSLLAEHIPGLSGGVTDMICTQSPDPTVWLVHSGGELSSFVYDRENNVTAWASHNFGSGSREIEGICAVFSNDGSGGALPGDSLIMLFDNDASAFSLESIHGTAMLSALTSYDPSYSATIGLISPSLFCDSWQLLTGSFSAGNTTFTVGSHLNGEKVVFTRLSTNATILNSDGSALEATVSGGNAVIAGNYSSNLYIVGVPYSAFATPNRFEITTQSGTAQLNKWKIARVAFRLFQSKYGNVMPRAIQTGSFLEADFSDATAIQYDGMNEFPWSSVSLRNYGVNGIPVKTGQTKVQPMGSDWDNCADVTIASRHPWPFNVLALLADVEVDGISGA
jgi:hypothetical protein